MAPKSKNGIEIPKRVFSAFIGDEVPEGITMDSPLFATIEGSNGKPLFDASLIADDEVADALETFRESLSKTMAHVTSLDEPPVSFDFEERAMVGAEKSLIDKS